MQKLDKPIELKGRVIRYKPIAKLLKKSPKMKGGKIIEKGIRAFILYPAINTKNPDHVSKLIQFDDDSEVENFVLFEIRLNETDKENRYHIPFISIEKIIHKVEPKHGNIQEHHYQEWLNHHNNELNSIKKQIGNQNFQSIVNHDFKFNYLVTVEYGGIPINKIIDQTYNIKNSGVFKNIFLGIVNIFNGILHFYENGINNCSITDLNILFLPNDPSKMRILNFKHCEPSDTELKKMYLIIDIYNLFIINYTDSLQNIENYKEKYNEYTHPSNNRNKVSEFFEKYPNLTNKETLDGIRSDILAIIDKLGKK